MKKNRNLLKCWLLAGLAGCMAPAAFAVPTTYFGEELVPGGAVVGSPLTARNSFVGQLASSSTENFNGFTPGSQAPLTGLFGDAKTSLALTGTPPAEASARVEDRTLIGGENFGRFNTSPGGGGWWQSNWGFEIQFGGAFSAFAFYGTDFGDFEGKLTLELLDGATVKESLVVGHRFEPPVVANVGPENGPINGSLLFFGFSDDINSYTGVRFVIGQGDPNDPDTWDTLGLDDMILGNVGTQPIPTPEPGTLALVGLSLIALTASRRRRR